MGLLLLQSDECFRLLLLAWREAGEQLSHECRGR